MHKQITSLQNPLIKQVLLLQDKSRERRKTGLFVIEGQREIDLAKKGGYLIDILLFCPEIVSEKTIEKLKGDLNTKFIEITFDIYKKLAYRTTTEGVIAVAKAKELALNDLKLETKNQLILVAEAPEKPGNIGALLRTADAAKLDAVIIANPKNRSLQP